MSHRSHTSLWRQMLQSGIMGQHPPLLSRRLLVPRRYSMPSLELPDIPQAPEELEDFVAALFQAAGYFVERNVRESERNENHTIHVLEMDVVATSYSGDCVDTIVAEAKSGDWGLADVFKLLGWLTYLGQKKGAFFVSHPMDGRNESSIYERFSPHGIDFFVLGDCTDVAARFAACGFGQAPSDDLVAHWRFAFMAERKLTKYLAHAIKSNLAPEGARVALNYHKLINDEVFFEPSAKIRLRQLYAGFGDHPKLALSISNELTGGSFSGEPTKAAHALFSEALYEAKHPIVQACFYLEHRARLAILKAAVDYFCEGEPSSQGGGLKVPAGWEELVIDWLPSSFQAGYAQLREHRYFRRYALFWQVFLWGFGGFYLSDRTADEFRLLAEQTGVPEGEIPNALRAFDLLFPLADGSSWLREVHTSRCRFIKTFPLPLRGLGANQRKRYYDVKSYDAFSYADYTTKDLSKWHMSAYELLESAVGPRVAVRAE